MYKCSNNIVPDYISDIVSPLVGEVTNYPLRNRHNIASMYTRTEISRKSCIPSSVSGWNNLNNNIRESDSYVSFRSTLKNEVLGNAQVPSYFMKGQRRLSVLHARLRNNCSDLKSDLFQNHLIVQELISVRALVFDLAQLTCQKRFDCRNAIIRSSETFLDTS